MVNSENRTRLTNQWSHRALPSIVTLFILFVTIATIAYTWSLQRSCDPLIAVKLPDRCYLANVSIDFKRLPWQNSEPLILKPGEEKQLNAKVDLMKGSPAIATSVTWQSSRPEITVIDAMGKLVALQPGEAEIRAWAQADPQKMGALKVQVRVMENVSEVSASENQAQPTETSPHSDKNTAQVGIVERSKTLLLRIEHLLPGKKKSRLKSNLKCLNDRFIARIYFK